MPNPFILMTLGAMTGLLSGLFGVGGGVVLVPLLVSVLGFNHQRAAGTSVAAILPAAIVGGIGYSVQGYIDWFAIIFVALGMVVGAQIGSYLLVKAPTLFLRWMFLGFLGITIVSLWFVVPPRQSNIEISFLTIGLLVALGLITGTLSGILGVGGGVVIVPVLMFAFNASDLIAKGTSLFVLIPSSISGTLGNIRRKNVDLRAATYMGFSASILSPIGSVVATKISPATSNILLSGMLVLIAVNMLLSLLRKKST